MCTLLYIMDIAHARAHNHRPIAQCGSTPEYHIIIIFIVTARCMSARNKFREEYR